MHYTPGCEIKPGMAMPAGVRRHVLAVEYKGTDFCGFQRQQNARNTVQEALETGLTRIAAHPVRIICAGRTDTGVHATWQVVHFDTAVERPERAWLLGLNTEMPRSVRAVAHFEMPEDFHARFSAVTRIYRYVFIHGTTPPALLHGLVTWLPYGVDLDRMRAAATYLQGEHDFSAFRASQCQASSPVRTLQSLQIDQCGGYCVVELRANGFLHHMVRNIMGSLFVVGRGSRPPEWVAEVLNGRDRQLAAATASSAGLYLCGVQYPERFQLPREPMGPPLW